MYTLRRLAVVALKSFLSYYAAEAGNRLARRHLPFPKPAKARKPKRTKRRNRRSSASPK